MFFTIFYIYSYTQTEYRQIFKTEIKFKKDFIFKINYIKKKIKKMRKTAGKS